MSSNTLLIQNILESVELVWLKILQLCFIVIVSTMETNEALARPAVLLNVYRGQS